MIGKLKVKFWKWNVNDGSRTNYFTASTGDFDFDLAELGLIGASSFSFQLEGDGDTLSISNVAVNLVNREVSVPIIDSNRLAGTIEAGNYGVFQPFYNVSGLADGQLVIAEVLVLVLHNELGELPYNADLRLGDVSSYNEFIETDEGIEYVVPFVGYIDMALTSQDLHNNTVTAQLIALDNLLSYLTPEDLEIEPLFNLNDLIELLLTKFPFIGNREIEPITLGFLEWIVPKTRTDLDTSFNEDTSFDHFTRQPAENAKLVAYSFDETEQVFYFKIKDSVNPYYKLTLPSYTLESDDSLPSAFVAGTETDYQMNGVDQCLTETTLDLGFTDIPFQQSSFVGFSIEGIKSEICMLPSAMVNIPAGITNPFNMTVWQNSDGDIVIWLFEWDDTTTTWTYRRGYLWESGLFGSEGSDYGNPEANVTILWREGWQRWWIIGESGANWSYPNPDISGYSRYDSSPYPRGAGEDFKVYSVGIELGENDGFEVYNADTVNEAHFVKYPVWFTYAGQSYCVAYAKAIGGSALDIDDIAIASASPVAKSFRKPINTIPTDMPKNPVYTYSVDNKLEIWWYSNGDLKCYDWQMNLKYLYGLGVDFQRVALGRDKDGKLLIVITTEEQIIVARHEISNNLYYPEIELEVDNAKALLTALAKWGFQAWWIDRRNGTNTFNFKSRYQGDVRGALVETTHTYKNAGSPEFAPNRDFSRRLWDKYADTVIVKSSYSELARAGREGLYKFEYTIPSRFFHYRFGERIANKIFGIIGVRRPLIKMPLFAYHASIYDYIELYGRDHCIVGLESDFTNEYITDLELVELRPPRELPYALINCLLADVYSQDGETWFYHDHLYTECYCAFCDTEYNELMTYITDLLTSEFSLGYIPDFPEISPETRSEIIRYLVSVLESDESLYSLIIAYENCYNSYCGGE